MRWLALVVAMVGCAHAPQQAARGYADALEAGRLEAAWAWSTGLSREAFAAKYAATDVRAARAREVRAGLGGKGSGLGLVLSNDLWRVLEVTQPQAGAGPSQALSRFFAGIEAADWPAVWTQLSAPWRARYAPERLGADFALEPQVQARLSRAKAAARSAPEVVFDRARFPIAQGTAVQLIYESDGWKIDALE